MKAGNGVDLNAGARKPPMPPRPATQSTGGVPIAPPKRPAAPTTPGALAAPAEPQMDATALTNIAAYLNETNQSIRISRGRSTRIGAGTDREPALTGRFYSDIGALQNAIAGLQTGAPIYEAWQAPDATDRAATAAAKLAPSPATTSTAPAKPVSRVARVSAWILRATSDEFR